VIVGVGVGVGVGVSVGVGVGVGVTPGVTIGVGVGVGVGEGGGGHAIDKTSANRTSAATIAEATLFLLSPLITLPSLLNGCHYNNTIRGI